MPATAQLNQMEVYICSSFVRSTLTVSFNYLILSLEKIFLPIRFFKF